MSWRIKCTFSAKVSSSTLDVSNGDRVVSTSSSTLPYSVTSAFKPYHLRFFSYKKERERERDRPNSWPSFPLYSSSPGKWSVKRKFFSVFLRISWEREWWRWVSKAYRSSSSSFSRLWYRLAIYWPRTYRRILRPRDYFYDYGGVWNRWIVHYKWLSLEFAGRLVDIHGWREYI